MDHLQLRIVPSRSRTGFHTMRTMDGEDLLKTLTARFRVGTLVRVISEADYQALLTATEMADGNDRAGM